MYEYTQIYTAISQKKKLENVTECRPTEPEELQICLFFCFSPSDWQMFVGRNGCSCLFGERFEAGFKDNVKFLYWLKVSTGKHHTLCNTHYGYGCLCLQTIEATPPPLPPSPSPLQLWVVLLHNATAGQIQIPKEHLYCYLHRMS